MEEFARREPDHRLVRLVADLADPSSCRALDLGCAAGRNTRYMADRGLDVVAVDAAPAMVARTRRDLSSILGAEAATLRTHVGRMDALSFSGDGAFDLVVALGIYHMARSEEELEAALAETARVLSPGGRLLSASFAPGTRLGDRTYRRVRGQGTVHEASDGERGCLLTAAELVERMAPHALVPLEPPETVVREAARSHRVVVNGLFALRETR